MTTIGGGYWCSGSEIWYLAAGFHKRSEPIMNRQTVAVGADHAGFELKAELAAELRRVGFDVRDCGTDGPDSVDYPDFAEKVVDAMKGGEAQWGVLVCGSGIGMSIAANRHPGIRAALCHDEQTARLARQHNDANVLVLGARLTDAERARACLRAFFETPFEAGRHSRRVAKLA